MTKTNKAFCGIIFLFTGFFLIISCGNTKTNKSDENSFQSDEGIDESINHSIALIDSIITGVPYPSMDTIDEVTNSSGMEEMEPSVMEETYHEADSVWNEFKALCSKKEYKKAYDLYYNNFGTVLLALKTTTSQYLFFTEVLSILDRKYDPDRAFEKLISNLDMNMMATSTVIKLSEGKNIPQHFSDLFMMSIVCNKRIGNMAAVKEIRELYTPIICEIEGKSEDEINRIIDTVLEE